MPVFSAVTPLALDLTTHLGKGMDAVSAKVSAIMEAIERHAAETVPEPQVRDSWSAMQARPEPAIDPRAFDLPQDTTFRPDRPVNWCRAFRLGDDRPVWLASDLVAVPPSDGLIGQVDTNGLASGNTWTEAIVHALAEVIERDAISRALFADLFADPGSTPAPERIDPGSLPPHLVRLWADLAGNSRQIVLHDLTTDIAVPVIRASLLDPAFPGPDGPEFRAFPGYGCDPNPELAVSRALTEAAQAEVATLQGARDSFNDRPHVTARSARHQAIAALEPGKGRDFGSLPWFESTDLRDDLDMMVHALENAGFPEIYVADLMQPSIAIPVVRIRVPGLSVFAVDQSRVGQRCLELLL